MTFAVAVLASAGCGLLTGVDFDKARLAETGLPPLEAGTASDGGRPDVPCAPEPNATVCAGRCGQVLDNCGSPRQCPESCGQASQCVDTHCECAAEGAWCNNRCGEARNNCNQPVVCGDCDGGLSCISNSCGCVPEPVETSCGGKGCGTVTNNCGQIVSCGNGGACANPAAVCQGDGTCCVDDGVACAGRCNVNVTNNCGQQVGCPAQCGGGQVCFATNCCQPDPNACLGVPCGPVVTCGQVQYCPDTCPYPYYCGGGGVGPNACGCDTPPYCF